uniref:Uncharacterized protein n=1 Tax=Glossina palpalis gambiensis TaxID=67801 RepID=A0A1B0AY11_9MUSC
LEPAPWQLLHRRHSERHAFWKSEINCQRDDPFYFQDKTARSLKYRLAVTTRRLIQLLLRQGCPSIITEVGLLTDVDVTLTKLPECIDITLTVMTVMGKDLLFNTMHNLLEKLNSVTNKVKNFTIRAYIEKPVTNDTTLLYPRKTYELFSKSRKDIHQMHNALNFKIFSPLFRQSFNHLKVPPYDGELRD